MKAPKTSLHFNNTGYYFIGLIALVILGFWPTYFSKFFDGTADFTFYFHFHAATLTLWMLMLIVQPILIRKRKLAWHRTIGKVSSLLFPLIFLGIILLAHSRHPVDQKDLDIQLFVPFKDLLILGVAYFIAIRYRNTVELHARGMIATGIVFIEPALARLLFTLMGESPWLYPITIFLIYSLLIFLIIRERKQQKGRWVFPLVLSLYVVVHSVLLLNIHIPVWVQFSNWFASLPLT